MNEIIAQLLGVDQGLISFGQRALHADARRGVDEGEQRRAIRQRGGGAVEHRPVAPREAAFKSEAMIRQPGDDGAQFVPV